MCLLKLKLKRNPGYVLYEETKVNQKKRNETNRALVSI